MDVAVTELRAHLADWLARARAGEEVIVTERGVPIVRLSAVESAALLERLADEGRIGRPSALSRPIAAGRARPRPRRPVSERIGLDRG